MLLKFLVSIEYSEKPVPDGVKFKCRDHASTSSMVACSTKQPEAGGLL